MVHPNPTVVVIPGAWHSPWHYERILALFVKANYPVSCLRLPSVGAADPASIMISTDIAFIREKLILPLIEEGKEVVLVMHSYGGAPGAAAAKGLSKIEVGADGKAGGIVGLIFLCAALADEGDSLLSQRGGQHDQWIVENNETGILDVPDPKLAFYSDVPEPLASEAASRLLPHSLSSLASPSQPPAWRDSAYDGRRAYIRTLKDAAIPAIAQEMLVKKTGVEWVVKDLDTAHSPFLSHPEELFEVCLGLIKDFTAIGS